MKSKSVNISTTERIKKLVVIGMFCAIAYVSLLVFHIKVAYLTFEFKDAIITFAGLIYGPLAALVMSIIVPLLEMVTIGTTGGYGLIMNFLAAATFSCTTVLIYKTKKNAISLTFGVIIATLVATGVMLLANFWITPYFIAGTTTEEIKELVPKLLLPFNLAKMIMNSSITIMLYATVMNVLKKSRLVPDDSACRSRGDSTEHKNGKQTKKILLISGALLLMAVAAVIFFVILKGHITVG